MWCKLILLWGMLLISVNALAAPATGPLRVLSTNPRYFTDGSGQAIYLTGSHTWCNFATDQGTIDPPEVFDFNKYLDFLASHNHNFFRGWVWDLAYSQEGGNGGPFYWDPFPWLRTGPNNATDGKPKFDLTRFNQAYFDRLHARALTAQNRGMYVSIMLFQGYGVQFNRNANDGYPLDGRNNINSIDAGTGYLAHTLQIPAVTAVEDEYVRRVIDAVNDLDNILYEISNESGSYATAWQYHMIDLVHQYEAGKAKQHPVGMTFQYSGGSNTELFNSPADWVSPDGGSGYGYPTDPPVADGRKVLINDTDHSFFWTGLQSAGLAAHQTWVWKNFLRGNQTLFMDPYLAKIQTRNNPVGTDSLEPFFGRSPDPYWETIRLAMGYARTYADKVNLAAMKPLNSLSSTSYCLADTGREYLVYQATSSSSFTVNLKAGTYNYEWFNPNTGAIASTSSFTVAADGNRNFTAPFSGDAVLYVHNNATPVTDDSRRKNASVLKSADYSNPIRAAVLCRYLQLDPDVIMYDLAGKQPAIHGPIRPGVYMVKSGAAWQKVIVVK
jgi:hypothetical protein